MKVSQLKEMLEEEESGEESLIMLDKIEQDLKDPIKIDPPPQEDSSYYSSTTIDTREQTNETSSLKLSNPPRPSDPGWTQYALSLFQDDEMDGEHPRLEGLRRVAEFLLGEVTEERCELISCPTMENGERACSKCTLVFSDGRIFEALADACPGNCTKDFAIYPTAMSDTRAKGRAYRAALRLKRVVSAEEIGVASGDEENINKNIQVGQITAIRLLADRSSISIKKLLDDLEISSVVKDGVVDLKFLRYSEALIVLNRLNNIRQEGVVQEKLKR